MKTMNASILFTCPGCHANFEFDSVGEYEFVPCPVCGTSYMTIKKGKKLLLENFEHNRICEAPAILV
jgi:Zn finger protein HypA/HybF involved in hydrogenase expression